MAELIKFINNKYECVEVGFSKNYQGNLFVQVYVTDKDGNCKERYNPTIEKEVIKNSFGRVDGVHMIIKPEYRNIQDSEENRKVILQKIKELANE